MVIFTKIRRGFFFLLSIIYCQTAFCQKTTINWDSVKNDHNIPKREVNWLLDSISNEERTNLINIVSSLSQPSAAQMIPSYFFVDGSNSSSLVRSYVDSFYVRPPDGIPGIIRVAYLSSRLRNAILVRQASNPVYVNKFNGNTFSLPKKTLSESNNNIKLSFDFEPANTIIDILSTPDITAAEIIKKTNTHFFDRLLSHHNQSFYTVPLSREQLVGCLERAASNKPMDLLYQYIQPYGLLNYNDVKNNLSAYKNLFAALEANEKDILHYIRASMSPYLPDTTSFSRRVSLFLIAGADGWASEDVATIDLNYFKDDYTKILNVLVHETYHSAQDAVALKSKIKRNKNEQDFADALENIFLEGTASYIAPPKLITPEAYNAAVHEGAALAEKGYNATIVAYDEKKAASIFDDGIAGGGPFYFMGAEMSKTIVAELGEKTLAGIIPYDGIMFFKTYFKAVDHSKKYTNKFSAPFEQYIKSMH